MSRIIIREVSPSTSADPAIVAADAEHGLTVAARTQTAGRGQRGNSWEAAPGMNLSFSTVIRPRRLPAREQFLLSMAVALAIAEFVADVLAESGFECSRVKVKWPNDIYVDDLKISGTLIENTLTGTSIDKSIVGVGLNVNQCEFVSDAPNPVSLAMLTHHTFNLDELLQRLVDDIIDACRQLDCDDIDKDMLVADYNHRLWRGDGLLHRWREASSDDFPYGRIVNAAIVNVAQNGMLTLRHEDGTLYAYAFKEIAALL